MGGCQTARQPQRELTGLRIRLRDFDGCHATETASDSLGKGLFPTLFEYVRIIPVELLEDSLRMLIYVSFHDERRWLRRVN